LLQSPKRGVLAMAEEAFGMTAHASCQTDGVALVSHYPANLLFAQGMLNTSMLQLQQVELQISRLHEYLREHRRLETSDKDAGQRGRYIFAGEAEAVVAAATALTAYTDANFPRDEAIPAAEEPRAEEPAPAADAAQEGQEAQRPLHRRRLAILFKVGMVMILLEVKLGWYFVYLLLALLYLGGTFDPWIEWGQNLANAQVTLEHQLNALRREQQAANEAASEEATQAASRGSEAEATTAEGGEENRSGEGAAESAVSEGEANAAAAQEAPAEAPARPPPPYWQRFIYQLFVMFFLTMLPWWNPNPRFL